MESFGPLFYVGGVLLAIKLAFFAVSLLKALYGAFLRSPVNLKKTYGEWAVVTGATDGIGKAFAFELAKKGLNIVLVSRSETKLKDTLAEINAKYPVQGKIVVADFSANTPQLYAAVKAALDGLDVGVLVNNVGMSYDFPEYFGELSEQKIDDLVSLNIVSLNKMTYLVLPGMVTRKKGAIINVSSGSGTLTCPLLSVYSASKAYVDNFSRSLGLEYASKGIFVQSLVPFFVVSKLSKMKQSLFTPSAAAFAREAVASIGYDTWTGGFWAHNIQHFIISLLPTGLVGSQVFSQHKDLRARALKKAQKAADEAAKTK